jgi:hypothetical protein
LYCCFIEKSIGLLKRRGSFAFIVSNGFLRLDSFEVLRNLLLENVSLRKIIDYERNVFESATVKTSILTFTKDKAVKNQVEIAEIDPETDLHTINFRRIDQDTFSKTYKSIFDLIAEAGIEIKHGVEWSRRRGQHIANEVIGAGVGLLRNLDLLRRRIDARDLEPGSLQQVRTVRSRMGCREYWRPPGDSKIVSTLRTVPACRRRDLVAP